MSGFAVAVALVAHVPGRLRPRPWKAPQSVAVRAVSAPTGGAVIVAAPGRPVVASRQRKAHRNPRRAKFIAMPRPDIYKAVRPPVAPLPVFIAALVESPLSPVPRPLLGGLGARVLAGPEDAVTRRLIRPG